MKFLKMIFFLFNPFAWFKDSFEVQVFLTSMDKVKKRKELLAKGFVSHENAFFLTKGKKSFLLEDDQDLVNKFEQLIEKTSIPDKVHFNYVPSGLVYEKAVKYAVNNNKVSYEAKRY